MPICWYLQNVWSRNKWGKLLFLWRMFEEKINLAKSWPRAYTGDTISRVVHFYTKHCGNKIYKRNPISLSCLLFRIMQHMVAYKPNLSLENTVIWNYCCSTCYDDQWLWQWWDDDDDKIIMAPMWSRWWGYDDNGDKRVTVAVNGGYSATPIHSPCPTFCQHSPEIFGISRETDLIVASFARIWHKTYSGFLVK